MINVYLPIADMSVDLVVLLGLGGVVGFVSGLFGVGGGFLLTPLLIFLGVPSTVAVGSGANQVVGSSVSGVLAHWRRHNVDFKMGCVMLAGGMTGSFLGVRLFAWLQKLGQVDLVINLCYVVFLGIVGGTMLIESLGSVMRHRRLASPRKRHRHRWHNLPFKMRFPRSGLYISALLPFGLGAFGGVLSAIMGVGGGFVLVPLMIYVLEMPTSVVIGTSLFQIVFVAANVTLLQAIHTRTVDVVLMLTLLVGAVIGAQIGARFATRLRSEHLRILLALMVLGVCGRLLYELVARPDDVFMLAGGGAG